MMNCVDPPKMEIESAYIVATIPERMRRGMDSVSEISIGGEPIECSIDRNALTPNSAVGVRKCEISANPGSTLNTSNTQNVTITGLRPTLSESQPLIMSKHTSTNPITRVAPKAALAFICSVADAYVVM